MAQLYNAVNYGNEPEDLRPHPNPSFRQAPEGEQDSPAAQPTEAEPRTIGDALEEAGHRRADKPIEQKDASAAQSAEARATGTPSGVAGGPAAHAQSLVDRGVPDTVGDAFQDAKSYLTGDKLVAQRDASGTQAAERRNDPQGRVEPARSC